MTAGNTLNAREIAARIPHGDSMSLLDRVEDWSPQEIFCSTRSHIKADNPLRENHQLFSVALVEYGAQAAAVHASLLQSGIGNAGPAYLGAVKSLVLGTELVPQTQAPLAIHARVELHNDGGAVYCFEASLQDRTLAQGRLVLVQP